MNQWHTVTYPTKVGQAESLKGITQVTLSSLASAASLTYKEDSDGICGAQIEAVMWQAQRWQSWKPIHVEVLCQRCVRTDLWDGKQTVAESYNQKYVARGSNVEHHHSAECQNSVSFAINVP